MSTLQPTERSELAHALRNLCMQAGRVVLDVYAGDFTVRKKADASPVSDADERAEAVILEGLARLAPGFAVVAEEQAASGVAPDVGDGRFFLVDPLDGTKEFVSRNGEFTVNIALIENGHPVVGVVHLPARGTTYSTEGDGTARRAAAGEPLVPISCRRPDQAAMTAIASRSHRDGATDAFLDTLPIGEIIAAGSSPEILPDCGRGRGYLSAIRPNHGMGHSRRPCGSGACRWSCNDGSGRAFALWQAGVREPALYCPGAVRPVRPG